MGAGGTVKLRIRGRAAECFARFCDVARLVEWMPGLIEARTLRDDELGRPSEVAFRVESNGALPIEYTLLYTYDATRHRVVWIPGEGAAWGMRGFAWFYDLLEAPGECEMRYYAQRAWNRSFDEELTNLDTDMVVESFKRWVEGAGSGAGASS